MKQTQPMPAFCFCEICQQEKRAYYRQRSTLRASIAYWLACIAITLGALVYTANTAPTLQTPVKGEAAHT